MRFIDEAKIKVHAGDGGNGCVAFRREAHVPKGGPSGGDGGCGGSVILVADPHLFTLLDLRYQKNYKAGRGKHGQGHDRDGRRGTDCIIRVPCGSLVYDIQTQTLLADLIQPGQHLIVATGGKGGHGNRRFVTAQNRAPRNATPGEPGEERDLGIELHLIADVGLVGLPNVGKSTLISKISAARPRIANYPFTTVTPNLGMVSLGRDRFFVVADIPGLMKGSHLGAGLGDRFLRHIQRTCILVILIDDRHTLSEEPLSPLDDVQLLLSELEAFDPECIQKPFILALNKSDLLTSERLYEIKTIFKEMKQPISIVSAETGHGIPNLLEQIWCQLQEERKNSPKTPSS